MAELPKTYDEWKYCITVKCGIALTQDYINERLSALSTVNDYSTEKFIEMWGPEHHQKPFNGLRRLQMSLKPNDEWLPELTAGRSKHRAKKKPT